MIFTKEQIEEIRRRLALMGKKDTGFEQAKLPLDGKETMVVVQNGVNKQLPVGDFFEKAFQMVNNLGVFNVSRYVQYTNPEAPAPSNLAAAIEACPQEVRTPGQIITFYKGGDKWALFQFTSSDGGDWEDTSVWYDISNVSYTNFSFTVTPDIVEEDTSVAISFEVLEGEVAQEVKIYFENTLIGTYTNVDSVNTSYTVSHGGTFKAVVNYYGKTYEFTDNVAMKYSAWFGVGSTPSDVMIMDYEVQLMDAEDESISITVDEGEEYLVLVTPVEMSRRFIISGATEVPVVYSEEEINGVSYKVYKSVSKFGVGTYGLIISNSSKGSGIDASTLARITANETDIATLNGLVTGNQTQEGLVSKVGSLGGDVSSLTKRHDIYEVTKDNSAEDEEGKSWTTTPATPTTVPLQLVANTSTMKLFLRKTSMSPSTPHVYYSSWDAYNNIPTSSYLGSGNVLVCYKDSGKLYICKFSSADNSLTPINTSNINAIPQIDNSDNPVQSQRLKQEFDNIDGRITNLESVAGIVGSNNSFNRLSDKDEDFTEFDYTKGNLGCFTPKVSEEDIVADDVDNIYTVKPPYEFSEEITDAKKPWLYDLNGTYILVGPKEQAEEATWVNLFGSLETYPHLWTDYELTKGSYICNIPNSYNAQTAVINTTESAKTIKDITIANSVEQGNENAFVLREIVKKESCIGFYINKTYNVVPQRFIRTSPTASIGGQSRAYFYFNLGSTNTNLIGRDTNNKYYRVKTTEYYSAEDGSLISKPTGAGTNSEKRAFSGGTPLSKTFDGNTFAIFEANNVQYFTRVISKYYDASGEVLPDADDILAISYKGKALVDGVERQQYLYRKDRYDQDGTWCYEKDGEFFNSSTHDKINKPNSDTPVTLDNTNTMYWPYTLAVSTNYSSDGLTYEERQQLMLSLPRDIIIVGENSGVATGGFITEGNFLYTAHSLVLYKVKFFTNQADGAVMIIADSYNKEDLKLLKGVDQVQVIGCEFDSAGYTYAAPDGTYTNESGQASVARKKSNYLMLHSQPNRKPFEGANNRTEKTQILVPDNYVNHLYIKGCTFHGGSCIIANDMRFVKSCRIIGNAFTEIMTVPVMISTQNTSGYSDNEVTIEKKAGEYLGYDPISGIVSSINYFEMTRPYMSCPIWIVGNEFSGRWQITKNRIGYNYFGGFLIEGACVYALHNVISNLISGVCYNSSLAYLPTYDAYCNCVQVYYANNTVKNIVRFRHPYKYIKETSITTDDTYNTSIDAGTIGIFKCKSTATGLVRGGAANRKVLRHYKNNIYSVEPEKILALWKTWLATLENVMGENAVLNNEYAYDSQLIEYDESGNTNIENIVSGIHYFSIRFDAMNTQTAFGSQSAETDEIVISGNMFDAGKGALVGNDNGARWCTNSFSLEHNIFKAYWMSSDQWQSPLKGDVSDNPSFETIMSQNFFNLELRKRKGRQTTLNVIGNEIICPRLEVGEQCTVHLVQNMFTTQTGNQWYSDSHGDISNVTGNHYTNEGTNGGRILSRIRISADGGGVYDWYSGTTLTRIPNKISPTDYVDLRGKYTTLNDKQTSLETTLFGSNTDGISDIRQLNPQPGDKYIATVEGVNKVFTCQEAGETTQISILTHKLLASSNSPKEVNIDLTKLVMPFTDSGGGDYLSLTSEQAQAICTNIGNLSDATRTAYGLTLLSGSTVKVSYNRGAQYVLEQFLLANDYIKYGSGTVNKKEPGHFAVTAEVTTGNNTTTDRYILIYPRYVGAIKESYAAKDSRTEVAELRNLLNYYYYNGRNVCITYNRPNTGTYVGKVTIDGKDPLYDNGVVIVSEGMLDTLTTNLGTTDGKANLNRTIINNLLTALNTMRKAQDQNAKNWIINDDGTITEERDS